MGKLTSITDVNGFTTSLTYEAAAPNRLLTVTEPAGRTLTLTYDTTFTSQVKTVSDTRAPPRTVTYSYSTTTGELTGVTDVDGRAWVYGYDTAHRLTTIKDPRLNTTTNVYDPATGKVTSQIDRRLKTTTFDYGTVAADGNAVASHREQAVVAMYLLGAAMACFLVLLSGLVRQLRATAAAGIAADLALSAGAVYVGLSFAAGVAFAAPAASVTLNLGGGSSVDPGFARSASTLGDVLLLLAAPLTGSVFLAAVCIGSRRTGLLPRWLTDSGLVVAAALLAGVAWFPLLLLLAWTFSLGVAALVAASIAPHRLSYPRSVTR